ncbi:hypothetical protein K402DRAFT_409410 [Aulographum hederae CBS 113979]|uniref:Uncharacterized protein n=1 Tax=Aulographum hederae CBS 113979 TaxID=1176131 RepID=A0A6G1HFN4_9PEZI|nr:hypothetical protein K402DRAFT_409410 [Aulographum hederae CBS 113979]
MDSPAILVARFLRTNNYTETLAAFVKEAGLPPDAGANPTKDDITIEKVLEEKKVFDLSLNFERLGFDEKEKGWRESAPSIPTIVTLPSSSNILNVSVDRVLTKGLETGRPLLLTSTADRRFSQLDATSPSLELLRSDTSLQDSPVLSYTILDQRYIICSSMSGKVIVYDFVEERICDERRDHNKYVVKVTHYKDEDTTWIATAGWDGKVFVYHINTSDGSPKLSEPISSLSLPTNPEALLVIPHPDAPFPLLIVTRRDSTFLYYYGLFAPPFASSESTTVPLLGRQNLAPHSNAWIAFTPSAIALHPKNPSLLAIATSSVPHMKLLIVRLLLPPPDGDTALLSLPPLSDIPTAPTSLLSDSANPTQASQARAALALQECEDAAIQINASTLAPQTPYSTPALAWRPDGNGVWVNGDDGVVRGVEARSGKVVARLGGLGYKGGEGHEPGSKIRCLWAGWVGVGSEEQEWVVSGGFDRRCVVWRVR